MPQHVFDGCHVGRLRGGDVLQHPHRPLLPQGDVDIVRQLFLGEHPEQVLLLDRGQLARGDSAGRVGDRRVGRGCGWLSPCERLPAAAPCQQQDESVRCLQSHLRSSSKE